MNVGVTVQIDVSIHVRVVMVYAEVIVLRNAITVVMDTVKLLVLDQIHQTPLLRVAELVMLHALQVIPHIVQVQIVIIHVCLTVHTMHKEMQRVMVVMHIVVQIA